MIDLKRNIYTARTSHANRETQGSLPRPDIIRSSQSNAGTKIFFFLINALYKARHLKILPAYLLANFPVSFTLLLSAPLSPTFMPGESAPPPAASPSMPIARATFASACSRNSD
jgi:hypothetical protein